MTPPLGVKNVKIRENSEEIRGPPGQCPGRFRFALNDLIAYDEKGFVVIS